MGVRPSPRKLGSSYLTRLLTVVVLAALGGASSADEAESQANDLAIGLVDNSNFQYWDGCGCGFTRPGEKPTPSMQRFILVGSGDRAWMNVGGEVTELKKTRDSIELQGKIGDEYAQRYEAADISVTAVCRATRFGDTHAVFFDAEITVVKGSLKQTVRAEGSCGC